MPEQIVLFQDYLVDLPPDVKRGILAEHGLEVLDRGKPGRSDRTDLASRAGHAEYLRFDRAAYGGLVAELRLAFARQAPDFLAALISVGPDALPLRSLSSQSRQVLLQLRERRGEILPPLRTWALERDNWYLVATDEDSFDLQSQLSSDFPCVVFENGPVECASPSGPLAALDDIEEILETTGVYQLWSEGRTGDKTTVVMLDTGVDKAFAAGPNVTADALVGMTPVDTDGHGSAVARLIRAICPKADILSLRVTEKARGGDVMNLVWGLVDLKGRGNVIVNVSLGVGPAYLRSRGGAGLRYQDGISSLVSGLANQDSMSIAAAGNDGKDYLWWPAAYEKTLAVGSHNSFLRRSSFSNHSLSATNYVLAPGGEVDERRRRTQAFGRFGTRQHTEPMYGTSFSAAIASSIACLLMHYPWFRKMQIPSRVSLFHNVCQHNDEDFPVLNVADIGAVWPLR